MEMWMLGRTRTDLGLRPQWKGIERERRRAEVIENKRERRRVKVE